MAVSIQRFLNSNLESMENENMWMWMLMFTTKLGVSPTTQQKRDEFYELGEFFRLAFHLHAMRCKSCAVNSPEHMVNDQLKLVVFFQMVHQCSSYQQFNLAMDIPNFK